MPAYERDFMNEITTTGMVLSTMPIGEYDRRVEILSSDLGRISAFARGARKPGSSLVSCTRVFAFGQFRLNQGRSSYNVKSAAIKDYFEQLAADMDLACYGFYFLEVSQYFTRENIESTQMLKLLYYSLKALESGKINNRLVRSIFELKTLAVNGLCPDFHPFEGTASPGVRKAYEHVRLSPVEKLFSFVLADHVQEEFENIVRMLMSRSVDRKFRSLDLLKY